jgi:DNA-directed RNA polymerase specialized sigma24 family protein
MATSPSPYPTEPKSLVLNQFEQKWLRLRMQDAVAQSWAEACSISERLFSEPYPADDLWERAVQRTASALREGDGTSMDVAKLLIRNFENASRNRKRGQVRILPMSDSAGSISVEDAVVAKLDFKKIMSDLHPKDREIFMLHFMTGRSWAEIAEMKGQSKLALKKRGARMVEQLRRKFGTRLHPK